MSIENSGTGVNPEDLDRIFEAFFTTKSEGMGMGLAICRSIIEAHDGRLWASSGVHRGAVFNVLLPNPSEHRQRRLARWRSLLIALPAP